MIPKKITADERPNVILLLTAGVVGVFMLPPMRQVRSEIEELKSAEERRDNPKKNEVDHLYMQNILKEIEEQSDGHQLLPR